MSNDIKIESGAIDAIQGDPERTICLVVTTDRLLSQQDDYNIRKAMAESFAGTKWEGIKVLIAERGMKIEALALTDDETARIESWRDREAML